MEEKTVFQAEVRYDLETYGEFNKIFTFTHSRTTICGIVYVLCMLYLLSALDFSAKFILAMSLFTLGFEIFHWFRNRDGGIPYKRMLRNHGQIPGYRITFGECGIVTANIDTGKEVPHRYADIRYLMETKRLLIPVDDLKTCHIIDKATLTGGSPEELVSFLREKCPKLKKRVRRGHMGCCVWYLMRIIPVIMLLISLAVLLHIPEKLSGQISGNMSYEEIAEELRPLGIDISPETIAELEQYDADNQFSFLSDGRTRTLNLLCWEGQGRFEKNVFHETFFAQAYDISWTPSTSGVYWFDLETGEFGQVYSNFLTGISAMDPTLSFTNVEEKWLGDTLVSGQGEVDFRFDYQGKQYSLTAQAQDDWFDTEMLYELGKILNRDADPHNLWYLFDGQGLLLYYGTPEEAEALNQKTGLLFLDPVETHFYG